MNALVPYFRKITGRARPEPQPDPLLAAFLASSEDADIEIAHAPGVASLTLKPKDFEHFRILINAFDCGNGEDARRSVIEQIESRLGFKFPGGVPKFQGSCMGMEFEGVPSISLPAGWSYKDKTDSRNVLVVDEQNRVRARLSQPSHLTDRMFLDFWPCLKFDSNIVASVVTKYMTKHGDREYESTSCRSHFMPSITLADEHVIPCFIYAHPAMWVKGPYDFTRLDQEMDAVRKAEAFIAQQTKTKFPGAVLKTGTETVTITSGNESLLMGIDVSGDLFAHWDDADSEEKIANLRAVLEVEVPRILGDNNSIILKMFPTREEIASIKENPPVYQAPPAKTWQKPVFWIENQMRKWHGQQPI